MAPAIPKLSGSSTFKPWWENFTRVIRMKRIVSFLLDPDTTIEEAEDSYAKYGYASLTASAPPSAASLAAPAPPSAGGSRRTTRGSSANTAPAVQAAAPPDAELVRKRRAEFIAAIEKVTEMLYDSVDTELFKNFTNGEDTKQMIHRLKILHEPKPGVVAATVEAEYVALMRTASFKNLGEWIDKWGRIMQTKIAEKDAAMKQLPGS
ncbi:hypothetical protein SEPCBS119000_001808 [Sporothrix epigloea]|uniref:Uncharacterized protein n=1 Tax=Sporothrix epigloea TaxID=1892477 RepID=A0ABP0DCQ9_9PEZI